VRRKAGAEAGAGKKDGRLRVEWQFESADEETDELFRALVPDSKPFVYIY